MNKFNHAYYNKILKEADSKGGYVDSITLIDLYLTELPDFIKDLTVGWTADFSGNNLTSCKNFPKLVGIRLDADRNNISSLEGLQSIPRSILDLSTNKLTSLEYISIIPPEKCDIIYLSSNKLTSSKGLENLSIRKLVVANNLISTWEGIPNNIGSMNINDNRLTGWEGMPQNLDTLYIKNNWDVVDFDGFEGVKHTLEISSSKWTSSKRSAQEISELISYTDKDPPLYIYVEKFSPV